MTDTHTDNTPCLNGAAFCGPQAKPHIWQWLTYWRSGPYHNLENFKTSSSARRAVDLCVLKRDRLRADLAVLWSRGYSHQALKLQCSVSDAEEEEGFYMLQSQGQMTTEWVIDKSLLLSVIGEDDITLCSSAYRVLKLYIGLYHNSVCIAT